jgi:hypothetical protein
LSAGGTIFGAPGAGRFATSGSQYLEVSQSAFNITFSSPVAAFGFYGTDIGDFNGQLTVTTQNGGSTLYTVANTVNGANGSLLFWGIIDTANPFISVTFGNTAAGVDFFGFDDMTIGDIQQVAQTPLPAALPLLIGGIGAMVMVARRRKNRQQAAE